MLKYQQVRLTSRQVALRDWRITDLALWGEWLKPHHRWRELDGPFYPKPDANRIYKILDHTKGQIVAATLPTPRRHLVIAERGSDKLIGRVSWNWESKETFWPQIGIVIFDESFWQRGFGYEALGLWSEYLFTNLPDIVRLDLRTWSGNKAMMRLADKMGFTLEARFRDARVVKGQYYDGLGYGILREEWQEQFPKGFRASL